MVDVIISRYLNTLDQWMQYYKFAQVTIEDNLQVEKIYKRSRFETIKFGTVDTYCFVKCSLENAAGDLLGSYSSQSFEFAAKHRTGRPLGMGAMLIVYPLLITKNISQELYTYLKNYCPKHMAAAEFPSVLDVATGYLYYYELTPVWGSAYYNGYRKESYSLYSPKAWAEFKAR